MTEEALMAAYCDGDMKAFDCLFSALAPHVHGFFRRSFHSDAVADDLLQTTFLKLHQARAQYHQGQPLRPWLFAIAARVRVDEYRRAQRLRLGPRGDGEIAGGAPALFADEPPIPDRGSARLVEDGERIQRVRDALNGLPESQRTIIHLHRYEGMTFSQIGKILGLSAGAAKLRAFRGYEQLRKHLRPSFESETQR